MQLTVLFRLALSALVIPTMTVRVLAQCVENCTVIHELTGEGPGNSHGWVSENAGDIDKDGVNDFMLSAPFLSLGRLYVYSGATGALLFPPVDSPGPSGQLGYTVDAAGDVNNDNTLDVIAGAPNNGTGMAFVFSGIDGQVLLTLAGEASGDFFGAAVAGIGDITGDGHADVVVAATLHSSLLNNSGRIYVYSGIDGSLLCRADGEVVGDQFGSGAALIGDVNGDNINDFTIGAMNAGPSGQGLAYVFSGADCLASDFITPLHVLVPPAPATNFGQWFMDGGDINGDGTPDVYVSDYGVNSAHVFSGIDGSLLQSFTGSGGFGIGRFIGDVNTDGREDLILASWISGDGAVAAGKADIISGKDGTILETFTHNVPNAQFGFDANGMGDVNGDGKTDYLVTAANFSNATGRSFVLAGTIRKIAPASQLLVTGWGSGNVTAFAVDTGEALDQRVVAGSGGLGSPHSVRFGPDGMLYVTSVATNRVLRFDAETGAFDSVFVNPAGTPLSAPTDANFGPDGNLYVASFNTGQILRFDGATGAFIDVFATGSGSGRTEMLEWGADGHMYLSTGQGNSVERYDGATGAPLPGPLGAAGTAQFVPPGSGIQDSHHLTFGPGGELYVASMGSARILKFDGTTGASLGTFVTAGSGGLSQPHGITFGPDGDLYACSFGTNNVIRYDGTTGALVDVFAVGGGLTQPTHLLFKLNPADFDGDVDVDADDAAFLQSCFGAPPARGGVTCEAADLDNDGDVDCDDWSAMKDLWTGAPGFPPIFLSCDTDCNTNNVSDDIDIADGLAADCNANLAPDSCDIADETSLDLDGNGIPDECCSPTAPVQPESVFTSNRFLSFTGSSTEMQAMRVTFVTLPPPFDLWNDSTLWVGPASLVSQKASSVAPVAGTPNFNAATLQCTPFFTDWVGLGIVHVLHEGIVPGGEYVIQATDIACSDLSNESSFSSALPLSTAIWGDTVLDLSEAPPQGPEGAVNVVDALAVLGRFSGVLSSISKSRADLEPACLDLQINVPDVLSSIAGFSGLNYPYVTSAPDPCDSTCPNVLP